MNGLKKRMVLLAGVLAMSSMTTVPALAANYTAIPGTQTQLEKVMIVDNDAEIPAATFTFTASAQSGADANGVLIDATETTVKVFAGLSPTSVKINGTAGSGTVTFAAGENKTPGTANDTYANDADKSYATKKIDLDFSAINFSEPGIYRYLITETTPQSPISAVGSTVTTVDVYVQDSGTGLAVQGYVAYDGEVTTAPKVAVASDIPASWEYDGETFDTQAEAEEAATQAGGTADDVIYHPAIPATTIPTLDGRTPNGAEAAAKDDKFRNELGTQELEFGKEVTGNQGSKDQYFKFTVTLNGLGAGTVLTAVPSNSNFLNPTDNNATTYNAVDMKTANTRDDSSKYKYNGTEYDSEALAHAAAIADIDTTTVAGKFIFGDVEYDSEEDAEAAAKAACIAPKSGQQLVANATGTVTWDVYLQDGQYITIQGLPEGSTYSITEENASGYKKTEGITASEGKGGVAYQDAVSGTIGEKQGDIIGYINTQDPGATMISVEDYEELSEEGRLGFEPVYDEVDQDVKTGYTNDRTGVLPTGVMTAIVPGALIAAAGLGVGGAFAFKKKRRKDDDED